MPGNTVSSNTVRTIILGFLVVLLIIGSGCEREKEIPGKKATGSLVTHYPDVLACGEETTWTMILKIPPGGIEEGGQIIVAYNEVFRGDSTGIDHEAHLKSRKGATLKEIPFKVPEVNEKLTRGMGNLPKIRMPRYTVYVQYKIMGAPLLEGDEFTLILKGKPFPYPIEWHIPIYIDKKGDDTFEKLPPIHTPHIRTIPGEPAVLRIVSSTTVQAGEPFDVRGIILDRYNNPPGGSYEGEVSLSSSDPDVTISKGTLSIRRADDGKFRFNGVVINTPGIQTLTVTGEGLESCTIPVDCSEEVPVYRLYWGLLHVHSNLSDGHQPPEKAYEYGRDIGLLDFCALADHNQRLEKASWQLTKDLSDRFYVPGRFVTFPGYEWSTIPGAMNRGYRQIYFPDSRNAILYKGSTNDVDASILDERVLMVAQLRSGADWDAPQPYQQRLVEIHTGFATAENTESLLESTFWRYTATKWRKEEISNYGTFQSGLEKDYRLGVIADGDDHSSTPGRCYYDGGAPNEPNKLGLGAVFARDLTRPEVFNSLYDRYTYGTTGVRIFVDFLMDWHHMGREYETAFPPEITYRVGAPGEIEKIEILRDNEVLFTIPGNGKIAGGKESDTTIPSGTHFYYLRVTLQTGDLAWSSPIWVTKKDRINKTIR